MVTVTLPSWFSQRTLSRPGVLFEGLCSSGPLLTLTCIYTRHPVFLEAALLSVDVTGTCDRPSSEVRVALIPLTPLLMMQQGSLVLLIGL